MSNNRFNKIIIASAGTRKTTYIVQVALLQKEQEVLILTYTNENIAQIKSYIIKEAGFLPLNIHVQSWFSFLFQECIRPYQKFVTKSRISMPIFVKGKSTTGVSKVNPNYFFTKQNGVYSDKISELACKINSISKGKIISRLESIYSKIIIDEVQDISGYDFDLIELLLKSNINCLFVGDCRQATYFTNCSPKYNPLKGKNIHHLFKRFENENLCKIIEKNDCYRSNQAICDFADKLYPNLSKSTSVSLKFSDHDGIYRIKLAQVHPYVIKYNPTILRWDRKSNTLGLEAINFGITKGKTFERVLIFPTEPIKKYLSDGSLTKIERKKNKRTGKTKETVKDAFQIAKFYVAITRAEFSVAFVYDGELFFTDIKDVP